MKVDHGKMNARRRTEVGTEPRGGAGDTGRGEGGSRVCVDNVCRNPSEDELVPRERRVVPNSSK
jgi:hypothetical protein